MNDQSHKDEMSAALRGDFQRLRARGVSATLVPQERAAQAAEPLGDDTAVRAEKPARAVDRADASPPKGPEPQAPAPETPAADPSPMPDEAPGSPELDPGEESTPPRPGWLSRLVGR